MKSQREPSTVIVRKMEFSHTTDTKEICTIVRTCLNIDITVETDDDQGTLTFIVFFDDNLIENTKEVIEMHFDSVGNIPFYPPDADNEFDSYDTWMSDSVYPEIGENKFFAPIKGEDWDNLSAQIDNRLREVFEKYGIEFPE